jgi:hypothetical protein
MGFPKASPKTNKKMNEIAWNDKSILGLANFLAVGDPDMLPRYLQAPEMKYIFTWQGQPDQRGLALDTSPTCTIVRMQIGIRSTGLEGELWFQGFFIRNAVMRRMPNGFLRSYVPLVQPYLCRDEEQYTHVGAFFPERRHKDGYTVTIIPKAPPQYIAGQLKRTRNSYQEAEDQNPDCPVSLILSHTLTAYCADFEDCKMGKAAAPMRC